MFPDLKPVAVSIIIEIVQLGPSPSQKNKTFVFGPKLNTKVTVNTHHHHHPPPPPKTFKEVPGRLES